MLGGKKVKECDGRNRGRRNVREDTRREDKGGAGREEGTAEEGDWGKEK